MATVTILDNPYATLWFHPEKGIVHHQIKQFISGQAFRELLLTGTDILTKHKATKWLSDDRSNAVLRPEDVEWSHEHWFPQTALAGWKFWAIVRPDKVDAVKDAFVGLGHHGLTVTEVKGHGIQKGVTQQWRGQDGSAMSGTPGSGSTGRTRSRSVWAPMGTVGLRRWATW